MKICNGRISSPFGDRIHPVLKTKKFHNGVDIACPIGTPVYTPVDAQVMKVYTHETGGLTVIIRDVSNNDRYGFCHLSKALVKEGAMIKKGTQVALSGNTGLGTGAHLHLSYSTGGYWKNREGFNFTFQDPASKIDFEL